MNIWVVSLEKGDEYGGLVWFPKQASAREYFHAEMRGLEPGEHLALWWHKTEQVDGQAITDEVDALWLDTWPPSNDQLILSASGDNA